jgi:Tat protein translocase TatB subunit
MFGIGYQEMFVVLVVALVIFGPSRLPELAGQVGRWVRDFRRMSSDLTGEFEKTFAEVDEVKKTIKREMQSIQDEVEGVGKAARTDLKKTGKTATSARKAPAGALKAGTASASASANSAATATGTGANGARGKMPGLEPRKRSARAGKNGGALDVAKLPAATKADPLADVSFFDLDAELVVAGNGAAAVTENGSAQADGDAALSRVRQRRAAAAYARRSAG